MSFPKVIKLDCPYCAQKITGIDYSVRCIFENGVRIRVGEVWRLSCGCELDEMILHKDSWWSKAGWSAILDHDEQPILVFQEDPQIWE